MGKKKLSDAFAKVKENSDKAFVPYIMAGDGGLSILEERINLLEKLGATAIELGIPFSDPVADGPTIQAAGIRALKEEVTLSSILLELQKLKGTYNIPIVIMTYLNPIFAYGVKRFAEDCTKAGVDGIIIPDLPLEEEELVSSELEKEEIAFIRLVSITSTEERKTELANKTEGFLYAVTVAGITGTRDSYQNDIGEYLSSLKAISKSPVLAGFGVATPEHVKQLGQYCDGVVVGSKIIDLFQHHDLGGIQKLIQASKCNPVVG
ncbi:tryptophan synthase subunit alpha [Heyndrickxia shackletonii]|uniref:Tryptophan synthase alpha chain n=1 Tax=Heyndrickxia shackletonii TaxID=157838 RepID=A0A0Q3WRD7_9BACI|nr:tryptophan synthase subunit alpha [Heyndrickxia shackletonii]KQL50332.1 tryptophan synthase subunit alpha [Heyndrickxia shackletonii]MBB2479466.1 tryptophan synthase subunit alpha [Bacillus sp. APMAM]NEZ01617.1 tryptophan synthase subunit alpha [Heyndrickxia shackletonii]RTZ56964.1 tryptophan synthase subunit alpha [Bacillus sp. SAJ1]